MKANPITGAHLFLVANSAGGSAKSTCAAEARVACAMEGVPFRLVTFDPSCQRLSRAFRGGVDRIAKANGELLRESFGTLVAQTHESGGIIIADMPPAFAEPHSPLLDAITGSGLLDEFASIALLIPVTNNLHHIEGALDALHALKSAGINHDRGLIRAWRTEITSQQWESIPEMHELTSKFPRWECPSYMQSMENMINGVEEFADLPALDKLSKMLGENSHHLSVRKRGQLRAAVNHLESARQAIHTHLLEPIMGKPATPAKSA